MAIFSLSKWWISTAFVENCCGELTRDDTGISKILWNRFAEDDRDAYALKPLRGDTTYRRIRIHGKSKIPQDEQEEAGSLVQI